MTAYDMTILETQLSNLDQDTAQRVMHLVFECNASLALALSAVHEANLSIGKERKKGSHEANPFTAYKHHHRSTRLLVCVEIITDIVGEIHT